MSILRPGILSSFTLHRYFALAFLKAIFAIIAFCALLVLLIDFTELLRRTSGLADVSALTVFALAAFRTPGILEQIIPFAILFGSMATLFSLSRRLELVVARGAGISVWQFLLPGFATALFIGVLSTTVINPAVDYLSDTARTMEADVFNRDVKLLSGEQSTVWLRKTNRSEDVIVGAARALNNGKNLYGVVIIRQGRSGNLIQRVDADTATLSGENDWLLENAVITVLKKERRQLPTYSIQLELTAEEVREGFANSQNRSFWSLPDLIEQARAADLPTYRYSLQFNTLLAQPFFFMAMVVIAATVSLKFIRNGNIGGLVLSGIAAGFVLYILRSLAEDLGNSGVVQPLLAAWLPALVTLLLGITLLLHQEDG